MSENFAAYPSAHGAGMSFEDVFSSSAETCQDSPGAGMDLPAFIWLGRLKTGDLNVGRHTKGADAVFALSETVATGRSEKPVRTNGCCCNLFPKTDAVHCNTGEQGVRDTRVLRDAERRKHASEDRARVHQNSPDGLRRVVNARGRVGARCCEEFLSAVCDRLDQDKICKDQMDDRALAPFSSMQRVVRRACGFAHMFATILPGQATVPLAAAKLEPCPAPINRATHIGAVNADVSCKKTVQRRIMDRNADVTEFTAEYAL